MQKHKVDSLDLSSSFDTPDKEAIKYYEQRKNYNKYADVSPEKRDNDIQQNIKKKIQELRQSSEKREERQKKMKELIDNPQSEIKQKPRHQNTDSDEDEIGKYSEEEDFELNELYQKHQNTQNKQNSLQRINDSESAFNPPTTSQKKQQLRNTLNFSDSDSEEEPDYAQEEKKYQQQQQVKQQDNLNRDLEIERQNYNYNQMQQNVRQNLNFDDLQQTPQSKNEYNTDENTDQKESVHNTVEEDQMNIQENDYKNQQEYYAFKAQQYEKEIENSDISSLQQSEQVHTKKQTKEEIQYQEYLLQKKLMEDKIRQEIQQENLKKQQKQQEQEQLQQQQSQKYYYEQSSQKSQKSDQNPKEEKFQVIEDRIKKLEDDLSKSQKLEKNNISNSHQQYLISNQSTNSKQNMYFLPKENQQQQQSSKYQQETLKNFDKFEREAHNLNEKVAQIKRELEESDSSLDEIHDLERIYKSNTKKTSNIKKQSRDFSEFTDDNQSESINLKFKSKFEKQKLDDQKQKVKELDYLQAKKQSSKHQKNERDLIIKSLQREKDLIRQISTLKKENTLLKMNTSQSKQNNSSHYHSHNHQYDNSHSLSVRNNKSMTNHQQYNSQPSLNENNRQQQQIRRQNKTPSRSKSRDIPRDHTNTPQFQSFANIINQHQSQFQQIKKAPTKLEQEYMKLEKEIELFKTVERIRNKLKKSICKKLNDQKILDRQRQKQYKEEQRKQYILHGQSFHSQHNKSRKRSLKARSSKSPYQSDNLKNLIHSPQPRHCENCAFLLNKGIPTSFCSCTQNK